MGRLVVIAPPLPAVGFALAGADIRLVHPEQLVADAVEAAAAEEAAVVAVHHQLWATVPVPVRTRWEARTDRLIVALPRDDGEPVADRQAALHELLARAVGYEIRFTPTSSGEPG